MQRRCYRRRPPPPSASHLNSGLQGRRPKGLAAKTAAHPERKRHATQEHRAGLNLPETTESLFPIGLPIAPFHHHTLEDSPPIQARYRHFSPYLVRSFHPTAIVKSAISRPLTLASGGRSKCSRYFS